MAGEATATFIDILPPQQLWPRQPLALLLGKVSSGAITLLGSLQFRLRSAQGIFPLRGTHPQHSNSSIKSRKKKNHLFIYLLGYNCNTEKKDKIVSS